MYAILVDPELCIGCNFCIEACQKIHRNIFPGEYYTKVIRIPENSERTLFIPISCMHCIDPPCSNSCPSQAISETSNGAVVIDYSKCIGCAYCSMSCPFQRIYYNATDKIPLKCDLCNDLIVIGEEPACVTVCPTKAKIFGTFEEMIRLGMDRMLQRSGGAILYQDKTRVLYIINSQQLEYLTKLKLDSVEVLAEEYPSWIKTSTDVLKYSRVIAIPLVAGLSFYLIYWRKKRIDEKHED